jgi:ABC-type nitrate/sulfonate/bicarbonate transport system permease component
MARTTPELTIAEAPSATPRVATSRPRQLARAAAGFARRDILTSVVAMLVGAVVWQIIALTVRAPWLPTCTSVVSNSFQLLGQSPFREALRSSIADTAIGYAISVVLGGVGGIAMGLSKTVALALKQYLNLLLFVPPIVTAPIFLVIFGLSRSTLLAVIVVFSATVIAVNCKVAVARTDADLLDVAAVFGASRRQRLSRVVMPGALPLIFTGLYLGVGRAVKGMIIGQLFLAVIGLGAFEARFEHAFDAVGIWSIALIVIVLSLILAWIVKFLDSVINYWAYGD